MLSNMPTKSIAVVGLKGVGMAHVAAAGRLGYRVAALVDKDEAILEHCKTEWCNRWMDLVECADVQPDTLYLKDVQDLRGLDVDLLVVCSPPHTHVDILRDIPRFAAKHVICEKPLCYPAMPPETNPCLVPVTISSEWAFHAALRELERNEGIYSMEMRYPVSRNTDWGYELPDVFDFTPHFFSILEGFGRRVLDMRQVQKGQFLVVTDKGDCTFWEGRRAEPFGFFVNNTVFHWQDNLFDLQLQAGCGAVTWERMADYDQMLRKCLRYEP